MGLDWEIAPTEHISIVRETAGESTEEPARVKDRNGLYEVALPGPLEPGASVTLRLKYSGAIHAGAGKKSAGFGAWILEDAVFIDSFGGLGGGLFLPMIGFV
ncbi:MAG: hypothetical protein AB1486_34185, partial [Planctomycetota bacterium]